MDIIRQGVAGTLESSDVYVELEPNGDGIVLELDSVVKEQFGASIRASVMDVLSQQGVRNAKVTITDRGALDCVIRARVETAVMRAKGE